MPSNHLVVLNPDHLCHVKNVLYQTGAIGTGNSENSGIIAGGALLNGT